MTTYRRGDIIMEEPFISMPKSIMDRNHFYVHLKEAIESFPTIKDKSERRIFENLIQVGLDYFLQEHLGQPLTPLITAELKAIYPFIDDVVLSPSGASAIMYLNKEFQESKEIYDDFLPPYSLDGIITDKVQQTFFDGLGETIVCELDEKSGDLLVRDDDGGRITHIIRKEEDGEYKKFYKVVEV